MIVVRPVREQDAPALKRLAEKAHVGLTTLPADESLIAQKIHQSSRSFHTPPLSPGPEVYFFVAEDTDTKRLIGTTAVYAKVGGFEPFYWYTIASETRRSAVLGVEVRHRYLKLTKIHDGPTEIGSLFVDPAHRGRGLGGLLSRGRFLFMKAFCAGFESEIIAEMRGVIDVKGRAPFWEALGRHFFKVDFKNADMMSLRDKRFIADLLPDCPIYLFLLPPRARRVLGRVHPNTEPAYQMLLREGFTFKNEIDIFEAGPLLRARRERIVTYRGTRPVEVRGVLREADQARPCLIGGGPFSSFKWTQARVSVNDGGLELPEDVMSALNLHTKDTVWVRWL